MSRGNKALLCAVPIILLVVYNVFVFTIFNADTKIFWSAWAFTMTALLLSTATIVLCVFRSPTLQDLFLNWPLARVSLTYTVVQIAASFVFMTLPNFGATVAILFQAAILAVFLLLVVSALFGGNVIAEVDKKQKAQTFFASVLASDLERLTARAKDPDVRNRLQNLYETARYSDPVSHDALAPLENVISAKVMELSSSVTAGGDIAALCNEITLLIGDRNSRCKFLK